jgi:hypothetical protein
VRHTVGPVLDEKLDALRPRLREAEQRFHPAVRRKRELEGVTPDEPALLRDVAGDVLHDLFDVKILDPAMGSGHFLVEAVDYVTDRLVRFLDGFPFLGVFFEGMRAAILEEMERQQVTVDPARLTDVTLLKRHVLKRCIYGVDLNPMAVELAKVSLWLDCFTLGAPLSFLDHHLRCGNSLIGAMAQEVAEEFESELPLFGTGPFSGLLRAAEIMRGISTIADVTLEQVRESGHLFEAFDEAAKPYKQLLDIRVAQHFDVERADEFLRTHTPEQALEIVRGQAEEVEPVYQEVVEQTRTLYDEKRFFHWDLEFPEVFIDLDQAQWREDGGFDAVIGNPPYASAKGEIENYLRLHFNVASYFIDLFHTFMERGLDILSTGGRFGYIVPEPWLTMEKLEPLRSYILAESNILQILQLTKPVFEDATVDNIVLISERETTPDEILILEGHNSRNKLYDVQERNRILQSSLVDTPGKRIEVRLTAEDQGILEQSRQISLPLEFLTSPSIGIQAYNRSKHTKAQIENRVFHSDKKESEDYLPEISGRHVGRYTLTIPNDQWVKYGSHLHDYRPLRYFTEPRILVREITREGKHKISAVYTSEVACNYKTSLIILPEDESYSLHYYLALINSSLISWIYIRTANKIVSDAFPRISVADLEQLPIRRIHFTTSEAERERLAALGITEATEWIETAEGGSVTSASFSAFSDSKLGRWLDERLSADPEQSDVVHDLLAHLAEQMIALHKQKQERVAAFWDALEAVTDADTFEDLSEHGKWEASLWKDPACRPYVDQESRSTRHLDESLGWDRDCYEAFAGMLAGKTSVTGPIIDVYREHHPSYRRLVERIASTDELIDQIVYRLYGLTDEEIAVVEGRATTAD